jgi:hypothetical protein
MHCLHKQQLPQQQATRAATFRVACPALRNVVLRATKSQDKFVLHQSNAVDAHAPQDAAAVNRRRIIMLSCACCSSLMMAGQQAPAQASEGAVFTYGTHD